VLPAGALATDVAAAVARAVTKDDVRRQARARDPRGPRDPRLGELLADPADALPAARPVQAPDPGPVAAGGLVAVWGPTGAPGRTTVAVTLAAELARLGLTTVLADADTYGGSVAQVLGLLDEAPGLAAAARAADHGTLDLDQLARTAPVVATRLRVLTGISRPQRWPELRGVALARVFALSRLLAAWTVVDCGFGIELDEELSFDTASPRRNGATLVALEAADTVIAVGSADPVGLQRLVRSLSELAELMPGVVPVVVVNRVRASAVGGPAEARVREALARYAGVEDPVLVPDDRPALDAALLAGRTLSEMSVTSPARLALAALARSVSGVPEPPRVIRWRVGARQIATTRHRARGAGRR
jgi:MinD-like ATPase involved in chromosome partitioning or flagellar assembly